VLGDDVVEVPHWLVDMDADGEPERIDGCRAQGASTNPRRHATGAMNATCSGGATAQKR
jgi:hypothetical protein